MIQVHSKSKDKIEEGQLKDLKTKKIVWADAINPTTAELALLAEHTRIPLKDLKEHLVSFERPNTFEFEKYSMIVFGCPVLGQVRPTTVAVYLIGNNNIITVSKKPIAGIERMKEGIHSKSPRYFDSAAKILRVIFDRIIDDFYTALDQHQEDADKAETKAFKKPDKSLLKEIFKTKKALLHLHKVCIANREVITHIEKQYLSKLSRKEIYEFKDIYNDLIQIIDSSEMIRDLITGVTDVYTTSVSNQTNIVMKKLTVAASYVLIPTLIASIYGMNFRFMPEIPWKWGYPFSLALMVISIIAMYIYFKKSHWL